MAITVKQAVKKAKKMLKQFIIAGCWEDEDGWVFSVAMDKKRRPVFMAPIKISKKDGEVSFMALNLDERFEYFDSHKEIDINNFM